MRSMIGTCALALTLGTPGSGLAPTARASGQVTVSEEELRWGREEVEHLWNRAGFGAGAATIERALALGPEGLVDALLSVESWLEEPFYARKRADGDLMKYVRALPPDERDKRMDELRKEDDAQVVDFLDWWVGRMLAGDEPLRERMVLFWHGHFTSSMEAVKSSYEMIQQNQLFRRHALGSFRELLHGVARDPAMLVYLDNASSKKQHPNENFARELLELYTLGIGNYTEEDVREVARAFTGWGQVNGRYHFDPERHDDGKKRVLGVTGRLDGDDVVEILLKQPVCARHVAHALLAYFEGREPEPERLESYAAELGDSGYRIDVFLRSLFLDPEFYSERVRAGRVSSPLDFLVGSARRLGVAPEPRVLVKGAKLLGQELFFPPSVRGWEGGRAWATGTSLIVRGELAGMLLGRVSGRELFGDRSDEVPVTAGDREPAMAEEAGARSRSREAGRLPRLNLTQRLSRGGVASDAELARALLDELLGVPAPEALAARVEERLARARAEHDLGEEVWSARPEIAEPLLRELAHGILALPEAQLD
jgi:uncharacterized protein (DUF1800 family)